LHLTGGLRNLGVKIRPRRPGSRKPLEGAD
jgi:hypothetical protein